MTEYKDLFQKVEILQNILVEFSTNGDADTNEYEKLRKELCANMLIKDMLPDFLTTQRTLKQFWQFIKAKFSTYADRRKYLWEEFGKVLYFLESHTVTPAEASISAKLKNLNQAYIYYEWDKALQRKAADPEAAITSARTLVETVCKHILDSLGVTYDDGLELPKMYKLTAQQLNLAPEQHHEAIFKQILSGCQTVVEGLGALRNKLSDAHGKSLAQVKPSARHAELAVNLAGSMAMFLLETFQGVPKK
jgi:hypothetical protein